MKASSGMGTAAPLSGGVDTGSIADVPRHQVPRQDVLLPREKSAFRKADMETEDSNEGLYHPYFFWGKTFIKRPRTETRLANQDMNREYPVDNRA